MTDFFDNYVSGSMMDQMSDNILNAYPSNAIYVGQGIPNVPIDYISMNSRPPFPNGLVPITTSLINSNGEFSLSGYTITYNGSGTKHIFITAQANVTLPPSNAATFEVRRNSDTAGRETFANTSARGNVNHPFRVDSNTFYIDRGDTITFVYGNGLGEATLRTIPGTDILFSEIIVYLLE